MEAGDTFKIQGARHLWVVLSDPAINPQEVLIANLSTDSGESHIDRSCTLNIGDHPFVRHATCIRYDRSRVVRNSELDRQLSSGQIRLDDPMPPSILERMRRGAMASDRIPLGNRQLLIDQRLANP